MPTLWPCEVAPIQVSVPDLTLTNLADVNTLAYWYAGNGLNASPDIDLSGSNVTAWRSRVGSYTLIPVSTAPTLTTQVARLKNRAAVTFSASRLKMVASILSGLSQWTLYAVIRPTTTSQQSWMSEEGVGGNVFNRFQVNAFAVQGGVGLHRKNDATVTQDKGSGNVYAHLDPVIVTITYNAGFVTIYVNGRQMATNAYTGTTSVVNFFLGGENAANFTGDIAMVMIQNVVETSKVPQIGAAYDIPVAYVVPTINPLQDMYIDPISGNDSTGLGTLAAPFQTFARSKWRWKPGGRVIMRGGICSEPIDNVFPTGSTLYPTRLTTYAAETVTIHPASSNRSGIYNDIDGRDHIVVDGKFVIDGTGITVDGIKFSNTDDLTLRGITVHNAPGQGVLIDSTCHTVVIDDLLLYSNGTVTGFDHNIYCKAGVMVTIKNCDTSAAVGYGIHIRGGIDTHTILNVYGNDSYSNHSGGLVAEYGNGNEVLSLGIHDNNFHDNNTVGMLVRADCGADNLDCYNNLCNNNTGTGITAGPMSTSPASLLFHNNTANNNSVRGFYLNDPNPMSTTPGDLQTYALWNNHLSANGKQFEPNIVSMAGMIFLWASGESPLLDGLKALWTFNGDLTDETGNHDLALETGSLPSFVAGRFLGKQAVFFNGAGTVKTPASTDFDPTGDFTIISLQQTPLIASRTLIASAIGTNLSWRMNTNSSPSMVAVGRNPSAADTARTASGSSNPSGWDYYTYLYNAAATTINIYKNLTSAGAVVISGGIQNIHADVYVGGDAPGNVGQRWVNPVDSLGFWKRLLSVGELIWMDNGGAGLQYPYETTV